MSNYRKLLFVVLTLLIAGVLACTGGAQKPSVEILSPASGVQVVVGEQVELEYRATDTTAVVRVELEAEGQSHNSLDLDFGVVIGPGERYDWFVGW